MLDILIRNGLVVDGSGAPRFPADVAIEGDRIADVGRLASARAETIIDAAGQMVTPGFVDMHSHSDMSIPILPTADSLAHQGITTVLFGQCGASPAPLFDENRASVIAALESSFFRLPWERWSTFGSFLDFLEETRCSINVVPLLGHGLVRAGVMGYVSTPATAEQMTQMQGEVAKAMNSGAIGVSTGLIYPPGSYAATEELISFTRPSGERNGYYFSHIRGEGDTLLEAIGEAIRIGRETGAAVQISHFKAFGKRNWDKAPRALQMLNDARAEGLDVSADMYPYIASNTGLRSVLPHWSQEGGRDALFKRLADPATRQKIAEHMRVVGDFSSLTWQNIMICECPRKTEYEGRFVSDLAVEAGKDPADWVFDALLETQAHIGIINFGMSEENLQMALRHPAIMIGTDAEGRSTEGPLSKSKPHPRNYGTFPRVLGRYVRELRVLSFEEAIWKMTGLAAQKLRWAERGLLKKEYKADLVIFDPQTVADCATFEEPHQYPQGINHVVVNGKFVIRDGKHTGARSGSVLRR